MNVFFVWPAMCVKRLPSSISLILLRRTIASSYAVIPTFTGPPTIHRTPMRCPLEVTPTTEEKPNVRIEPLTE
ncbi:hypothetical protein BD769DRAFT_1473869 [Suillus cothurnatus]|nr:hypothetical protein BD769DRAFT_1473869 [Suillus cothurnatus]